MKTIQKEENNEKKEQLRNMKEKCYSEETFQKEIIQFSTIQRSQWNLCQLDNYCLFITSRFFNSIDDHINFIRVTKKLKLNMEKFHYNPISLNQRTISFFPNIQTFHSYTEEDEYLINDKIIKYVDWKTRGWYESLNILKDYKTIEKNVEFKRIVFTREDFEHLVMERGDKSELLEIPYGVNEIGKIVDDNYIGLFYKNIIIPKTVTSLSYNSFAYICPLLLFLSLPENLTNIPRNLFVSLTELRLLTISSQFTFYGDRLFRESNGCLLEVGFDGKKASNRASNLENFSIEFSNFHLNVEKLV